MVIGCGSPAKQLAGQPKISRVLVPASRGPLFMRFGQYSGLEGLAVGGRYEASEFRLAVKH